MKLKTLVLAGLIAATSLNAANWKFAIDEWANDPQEIYAKAFKEYVEDNSRHKIKIYTAGTLGDGTDIMEQTRAGLVQFMGAGTGYMGTTIPEMDLFTLPYVMPTDTKVIDHFFKNSKVLKDMLPPVFNKAGLKLLAVFPEGEMAVTTFTEFHSPEDLKGRKMRVMPGSPILVETYKAFGASPQPMSWGDLVGALKTGMVDGQENPTVWIEAYGLDKLTKVLTYTGHGHYNGAAAVNKEFFDKLSSRDKELVEAAGAHAHKTILSAARDLDVKGLGKIIRKIPDYKIVTLTAEERAPFMKRAKTVQDSFASKSESNGKLLMQMKKDLEVATASAAKPAKK
jgi:TRAP-type C4-dicarboxylate transport system substrate-binding protein